MRPSEHHTRWDNTAQPSRLPGYLATAYALLTLYACLHPFSGWTNYGVPPLHFLFAAWPKYITQMDIWLNVAGFVPLGFTFAAARRGRNAVGVAILVTLCCALLSFSVEFLQNFLPTRVASNVDLATNTLGGLLGSVVGLRWGGMFDRGGMIDRLRERYVLSGHIGEFGMVLVGLWWLTQLGPTSTLFGIGDLRPLFDLPAPLDYSAPRFIRVEAVIVACNLLALGLVVFRCLRAREVAIAAGVVGVGLLMRSLADTLFIEPADALAWLTPGAKWGLGCGALALLLASRLSRNTQHSLACMTLLLATALVNLAPENPFQPNSMRTIQEGHFLNFNGLTRLAACMWPFLALAYLTARSAVAARR